MLKYLLITDQFELNLPVLSHQLKSQI
uniref:Uncharacterized protein n=1 Tax=Rhizophora mucronata TaxID=61149 RepID=A0A2P2J4M0_RHIMU